jgi:hypothetical protein
MVTVHCYSDENTMTGLEKMFNEFFSYYFDNKLIFCLFDTKNKANE